jgi:hypothetical protein
MSYAQKNYPQTQGINGRYSIESIGCFLTAFCNLELDFGNNIDPLTLNNYFVSHNSYIDIDDGIRDDLDWGSVAKYDAGTVVSHTANHGTDQTAGWPSHSQSIVRFYYQSIAHPKLANGQPNMIFHFCKVADASAHLILDSWDGQVKKSPYGEPTAWAEYAHNQTAAPAPVAAPQVGYTPLSQDVLITAPQALQVRSAPTLSAPAHQANTPDGSLHAGNVVTITGWAHGDSVNNNNIWLRSLQGHWFWSGGTNFNLNQVVPVATPKPIVPAPVPTQPPAAPIPIPFDTSPYIVVKSILGFTTSNNAANHTNAKGTIEAGSYYIFNRRYAQDNPTQLIALNVTKVLGKPGSWINPHDNVPDPEPTPEPVTVSTDWHTPASSTPVAATSEEDWKNTYVTFKDVNGNPEPRRYIAMNELKVIDYEGKRSDQDWKQYKDSEIAGTFIKDNVRIARPQFFADKGLWLGVPEVDPATGLLNIELYDDVYSTKTVAAERKVLHTQTAVDHIAEIKSILEKDFQRVMDVVRPKKK